MAFTSVRTPDHSTVVGDKRWVYGTYVSDSGSIGGNIDTGLGLCEFMRLQSKGSSVAGNNPTVNETMPVDGSEVTIVTDSNESGQWEAYGTNI